jgi:DNA-binding NarL/FixJ family response regulator
MLCDFESMQDESVRTVQRVKARWPQLRCVVLVDDDTAYQQAKAVGADRILTKGVLAAKLLETIEELLSASGGGEKGPSYART